MQLTNFTKSAPDSRDYQYSGVTQGLPSSVDLRQYVPDIEDQRAEGSCTCNAMTSALELMTKRAGKWEDLSRQFPYYVVREFEKNLAGEGASMRDVLQLGSTVGFCLESEWPYLPENENVKPSDAAYASAKTRLITHYEAVPLATLGSNVGYWDQIDNLKAALAEGLPVLIGMSVNQTIFDLKGPLASQNYSLRDPGTLQPYPSIGNHEVYLVGYDDALGGFIFANSWGTTWGDNGYGLIKYGVIGGVIFEAWVVSGFNGVEIKKPDPVPAPAPAPAPAPIPAPQPAPFPPQPAPAPVPPAPIPPAPEPTPAPPPQPSPVPQPTPVPPVPQPTPSNTNNNLDVIVIGALLLAVVAYFFMH